MPPAHTATIAAWPALRRLAADRRLLRRVRPGAHGILATGLAVVALAAAATVDSRGTAERLIGLVIGFVAMQLVASRVQRVLARRATRPWLDSMRLLLAAGFVALVVLSADADGGRLPVTALYLPIVAMAAASGRLQAIVVGSASLGLYWAVDLATGVPSEQSTLRGLALVGAGGLLFVGTRSTIGALNTALASMRAARRLERRRQRHMDGIEEIGRLLALHGPDPGVLDQVLGVLTAGFGYRHVSIYVARDGGLALGAQRGYAEPITWFDGSFGVMGRILRTHAVAFVPDVSLDPDYRCADSAVRSEISAPLLHGGEVVGILNVESTEERVLDESDVRVFVAIADRLASAFVIARERSVLAERVDAFTAVVRFGAAITRLDGANLHDRILSAIVDVLPVDIATLVVQEPGTERFVIRGSRTAAGTVDLVGVEIEPGQGMAGRALLERTLVGASDFGPESFPPGMRAAGITDRYAHAIGVPFMRDDVPIGSMFLGRIAANRPFTALELEVVELLATQAALALSNAFLHDEVAALAQRDGLTGLSNRRSFDELFEQVVQRHRRYHTDDGATLAVILFDIDHFGQFNNEHGHAVGDDVLRRFAEVLRQRARAADLVARYGGEEFVVVLENATRGDAVRVADTVRRAFGAGTTIGAEGRPVSATVSAGVAEFSADDSTTEALLRTADVGLYMAKRSGRNRVVAA